MYPDYYDSYEGCCHSWPIKQTTPSGSHYNDHGNESFQAGAFHLTRGRGQCGAFQVDYTNRRGQSGAFQAHYTNGRGQSGAFRAHYTNGRGQSGAFQAHYTNGSVNVVPSELIILMEGVKVVPSSTDKSSPQPIQISRSAKQLLSHLPNVKKKQKLQDNINSRTFNSLEDDKIRPFVLNLHLHPANTIKINFSHHDSKKLVVTADNKGEKIPFMAHLHELSEDSLAVSQLSEIVQDLHLMGQNRYPIFPKTMLSGTMKGIGFREAMEDNHFAAFKNNYSFMEEFGLPNWSDSEWKDFPIEEKILCSAIIFAYINPQTGQPIIPHSPQCGPTIRFPEYNCELNLGISPGIIELVWASNQVEHHTTIAADGFCSTDELTHFGSLFQTSGTMIECAEILANLFPDEKAARIYGRSKRNEVENRRAV
ncbi:hypothetical protein H4Q26_009420 [Puccinia striiformis f. sp. tritici PST-130]|nr:hypothetical protein H4Q26_009420 [Puccinia striiformis f. sp. tritici PST-130]